MNTLSLYTNDDYMKLQIIQDNKGKKTGVFIPIQDWNELKKQYRELEKLEDAPPSKAELLQELRRAVKELSLIEQRKLKPRPVNALIREL